MKINEITSKEKNSKSLGRKVAGIGVAIFVPVSEFRILYKHCISSPLKHLSRVKKLLVNYNRDSRQVTWEQAVNDTGLSVEKLMRNYCNLRRLWWFFMSVSACLSLILMCLIILSFNDLPGVTIQRAAVTEFILLQLTVIGFIKTLTITYRLWQLTEKRVSANERGRFKDFLSEENWCKKSIFLK